MGFYRRASGDVGMAIAILGVAALGVVAWIRELVIPGFDFVSVLMTWAFYIAVALLCVLGIGGVLAVLWAVLVVVDKFSEPSQEDAPPRWSSLNEEVRR